MRWVLQDNLYNEDGYVRLIDALDRLEQTYDIVKVVPFVGELIPDVEYDDDELVMVMGSYSMMKAGRRKGWKPTGYDSDQFDHRVWVNYLGTHLLNYNGIVMRFGDVNGKQYDGISFFIRPIFDFKEFAGEVITDAASFTAWQEKAVAYGDTLDGDTLVVVAPVKRILAEYRLFVVNSEIVTGSQYKIGQRVKSTPFVDKEVYDFAYNMIDLFEPDHAYVMDIAQTDKGFKVIEYNCINCSGFYACDCQKIVNALKDMV
jgi:hypothetical protein